MGKAKTTTTAAAKANISEPNACSDPPCNIVLMTDRDGKIDKDGRRDLKKSRVCARHAAEGCDPDEPCTTGTPCVRHA